MALPFTPLLFGGYQVIPHLSDSQIDALRRRALTPAELLALDDHLVGCAECRSRLATPELAGAGVGALHFSLQEAARQPGHLSYEQLEGYVSGMLDETDAEVVESHLSLCESCKVEMAELQGFKAALDLAPQDLPAAARREPIAGRLSAFLRATFSWFPIPLAGAAVVTALIFWIHTLSLRTEIRDLTSQISSLEQSDAALRAEQEAGRQKVASLESFIKKLGVNGSEPEALPSPPAPGIVLNDGGSSVTFDAQGRLSGLERLAPPVRDAVQSALVRRRAETPGLLKDLIGRQGTMLSGSGETGPRFNLAHPVGTVALTDRPKFSWMPLAGASSYVVSVYDANFNLTATSGPLSSTSWVPEKPLPRGAQLSWEVRALRGSEEIIAPAPPSPEARFIVLGGVEAAQLQTTLMAVTGSHLARGVIYAKVGALDEAESEFRALLSDNPESPIARRLLDSLLKLRHP
jgi:anti-sigma factor RsiW